MNQIDTIKLEGSGGAIWGTETEDLDATVVRWDSGLGVGLHTNDEVDVIMTVLLGSGSVTVDGETSLLAPGQIAVIPRGTAREIKAGSDGITYLNVHKRRKRMLPNMTRPK
ncbi:MAG: cupin domain-containing protein [Armatimonadota bacterium]